jgi:hypothetical protein
MYCDTLDITQNSEQAEIYETKAWQTYSDTDAISHDQRTGSGEFGKYRSDSATLPPAFNVDQLQ